jgi:eukaryotic-like serine/threonine-protein kinase
MTGRRLLHYEILEKLGEGGMGVVYKARDTHLDRFVAIKVLPEERMADPERMRRFVQEARAASALHHANIITIHDVSQSDGVDFIVMEHIEGKTLDALIPRNGMRLAEVLKIAVQMTGALAAAHAKGIVHRDLKPGNVMVTPEGTVKILDFGLAKLTEPADPSPDSATRTMKASTEEGTILGTVAYMAPEQAEGRAVDARSDIFSFGSVLYEMVTGRRAFRGDTKLSTLAAIVNQEPEPLGALVPHDFEKIIARCLRKNPEKRFHFMKDVMVELEEMKEESDSGKLAEAAPTERPSRRVAIWAGAALAVGLLAGGGWYLRTAVWKSNAPLVAVPLTSDPGTQMSPSFSPDGKQVVFSWNGEKQDNFDIYLKLIGSPTSVRLTTNPATDFDPVFSPDGRSIGFVRWVSGRSSFITISALGGAERIVADNLPDVSSKTDGPWPRGRAFDWLPDGKWIVTDGLNALSIESGETRKLTTPDGPSTLDYSPAVSPDGRTVAFCRLSGALIADIWLLDLTEDLKPKAEPRRLTHLNLNLGGLAWTPDGKGIVFSAGQAIQNQSIWRVSISGSGPPERLQFGVENASVPAVARNGTRLAFQRPRSDVNIYRLSLSASGVPLARPAQFLSSTRAEYTPQYSPDGTRIAFQSDRGGGYGVWVSEADGSNVAELASKPGTHAGTPRWSPDGTKITFDWNADGNWNIYVIRSSGGKPLRLTSDPATDSIPSWSHDGKWIYFASNRSGRNEVWKAPADGGDAAQVTRNGGYVAFESADGASLFYKKDDGPTPLWTMPLGSGEERQVLSTVFLRNFFAAGKGVYFMTPRSPTGEFSIQFLNTATGKVNTIITISGNPANGLSVSPDGRSILYAQADSLGQDLMLVENFR